MAVKFSRLRMMQEGRDAVIAECLHGAEPAACHYRRDTKSAFYWEFGASRAREVIDRLMRIGA